MTIKGHENCGPKCVMCSAMKKGLTQEQALMNLKGGFGSMIEKCGLAIVGTFHNRGPLIYTIGFTEIGLPEIIVMGLNHKVIGPILNEYYAQVVAKKRPDVEVLIDDLFNFPIPVVNADLVMARELAGMAEAYYEETDKEPAYVQWILCDRSGIMLWEAGYDNDYMDPVQTVLGLPGIVH